MVSRGTGLLLTGPKRAALKRRLDRLYETFDRSYLDSDPLMFVHRYDTDADREVVGFLASGLAFGNVRAIQASVSTLLTAMGPFPSQYIDRFEPERHADTLAGIYHRWIDASDLIALMVVLRRMREKGGSIGGFFMAGYEPRDQDVEGSLTSFSERARMLAPETAGMGTVAPFFPSPRGGSACKRLNLYLRWMVRVHDGLDLGLWPGVSTHQLVIPLDTHLVRLSRALGLTRRRSPGWAMAVEATRSLALLDHDDPVKYDFSLSRLGILDLCLHGRDALECRKCGPPPVIVRQPGARSRESTNRPSPPRRS